MVLTSKMCETPASLLKMSLFHWCFSHILLVKNQIPGSAITGTLAGNGLMTFHLRYLQGSWLNLHYEEGVALRCSAKNVFLEISQNLQKNACARDSF